MEEFQKYIWEMSDNAKHKVIIIDTCNSQYSFVWLDQGALNLHKYSKDEMEKILKRGLKKVYKIKDLLCTKK
jgi:hypothetical protein